MGQTDRAVENLRKGYELRDRVSEFENYAISNVYYRDCVGNYNKALQVTQRWDQAYPHKALPLFNMASLYGNWLGRYDEALAPILESLRLEPSTAMYANALDGYLALNRLDEAKAIIQEARARKMDMPHFGYALYMIAFRQKDKAGMDANEPAVRRYMGPGSLEFVQEIYRGRLVSMHDFLRRKVMSPSQLIWSARFLALVGYSDEAKIAAMDAVRKSTSRELQGNAAVILALAGDNTGAQKLAADLNQRFPEATSIRYCYVPSIRAVLALRQGKPQEAIESLVPASSYEMVRSSEMIAVYLRGQAYLAVRQGIQAAAEFQKMLDHPSIAFYDIHRNILPLLGLARAYTLQGDMAKARAAYQDFLTLWKEADPDIPILKQAQAEYAAIQKKGIAMIGKVPGSFEKATPIGYWGNERDVSLKRREKGCG
jgi:eukaryotic-like serine/threonine-protein kinase